MPGSAMRTWNSVKTKLALWCLGATAGSRMARKMEPTTCQAAENVDTQASTRVGIVFTRPCMQSTAAPQQHKMTSVKAR